MTNKGDKIYTGKPIRGLLTDKYAIGRFKGYIEP